MQHLDTNLYAAFVRIRMHFGIPTREEILRHILKTKTYTVLPEGWEFK